jgi:hypothetical protein
VELYLRNPTHVAEAVFTRVMIIPYLDQGKRKGGNITTIQLGSPSF